MVRKNLIQVALDWALNGYDSPAEVVLIRGRERRKTGKHWEWGVAQFGGAVSLQWINPFNQYLSVLLCQALFQALRTQ